MLPWFQVHEKKEPGVIKCSLCPEVFYGIVELQQHFFSAHSASLQDTGPLDKPASTAAAAPPLTNKNYHCSECGKEFPSLNSVQGHMRVHSSGE